jgi:hypothetical protein
MKKIDLSRLTDEELVIEKAKRKSAFTTYNIILALLVGIAAFNTGKNGVGFFTFFSFFFTPIAFVNYMSCKAANDEMKARNLY